MSAIATIYTKQFCPFCHRALALLDQKKISFNDIPVDGKPLLQADMAKKAGGASTVPQIWIGDTHVGGCDALFALERNGALDTLIEQAKG